jgi:hypothetical protein
MDEMTKRNIIMDNYQNPYHKEEHKEYDYKRANNPSCIDDINLYIKMNKNIIEDITFTGEACVISTSATSIMIRNLIGKTKEEAIKLIDNFINMVHEKEYDETLLNELIVYDKIYLQPNRVTCALLPFKSIKEYLMEKEK